MNGKNVLKKIDKEKIIAKFRQLKEHRTFSTINQKDFWQKLRDILSLNTYKSVLFIMLFVLIYYAFIAAPRYVSSSYISVRSAGDNQGSSLNGLSALISPGTVNSNEDLIFLKTYITSLDMLKILDEKIGIRKLYESQKLDIFFRLYEDDSQESFLKFYQARVKVIDETGMLKLEVEGFSPEQSYTIATAILEESEKFVNEISHKSAREQLQFAETELVKYRDDYQKSRDKLIAFQNEHGVFDPLQEAENRASFTAQMEAEIASKEAKLLAMRSYINDDAPQLVTLRAEIKALKEQLEKEKNKVVSSSTKDQLNNLASDFQKLTIEAGFAEKAYTTALSSFETTRIEAIRKIKHLVIVQNPSYPQSETYPRKTYNIISIFVILSLAFGVLRLIKTIIEEHKY